MFWFDSVTESFKRHFFWCNCQQVLFYHSAMFLSLEIPDFFQKKTFFSIASSNMARLFWLACYWTLYASFGFLSTYESHSVWDFGETLIVLTQSIIQISVINLSKIPLTEKILTFAFYARWVLMNCAFRTHPTSPLSSQLLFFESSSPFPSVEDRNVFGNSF